MGNLVLWETKPIYEPKFDIYIKVKNSTVHDIDDIRLHNLYRSRNIAPLQKNAWERFECLSSADEVLDPAFPAHEPNPSNNRNSIFCWRFGAFHRNCIWIIFLYRTKHNIAPKPWKQLKDIFMDWGLLPQNLGASFLQKNKEIKPKSTGKRKDY